MTIQHTPTPWRMGQTGLTPVYAGFHRGTYVNDGKDLICFVPALTDEKSKANAAFIVRACNAHDGLVDALEQAEMDFETMFSCLGKQDKELCKVILPRIKAALAKAKGES